ncbi:MAG: RNA polymerase sigma factor [Candidatus Acidiferrales bacterium]
MGVEDELSRLRRGDPEALGALVERYQHRLYRYLCRMVSDPAAAEDLFQQTWLRVAEQIHRYDERRNFDAWLFRVAHNLAIDSLRRYRPESLDEPLPSGESRVERLPADAPSALDLVVEREWSGRIAGAIGQLPAIYREVLALRFEEEMKLEEISESLSAPLSTVKTRLRRALEALRQRLEASGAVREVTP